MFYVTGDTHGIQEKWVEQISKPLHDGDILLICGDFGVGFWDGKYWSEQTFYDYISDQPYTVLFIDGNHENFDYLNSLPVEDWCGGRVHKLRHNLIHLMRGEIYNIDGKTIFTMGGGNTFDKAYRTEGYDWWQGDMPSEDEYQNARDNLAKADYKVDYIITHTAPSETVYFLSTKHDLGIKRNDTCELPLTSFLDEVCLKVEYKHWYFGHFHVDMELWRNQTALLNYMRELETGRVACTWIGHEGVI